MLMRQSESYISTITMCSYFDRSAIFTIYTFPLLSFTWWKTWKVTRPNPLCVTISTKRHFTLVPRCQVKHWEFPNVGLRSLTNLTFHRQEPKGAIVEIKCWFSNSFFPDNRTQDWKSSLREIVCIQAIPQAKVGDGSLAQDGLVKGDNKFAHRHKTIKENNQCLVFIDLVRVPIVVWDVSRALKRKVHTAMLRIWSKINNYALAR